MWDQKRVPLDDNFSHLAYSYASAVVHNFNSLMCLSIGDEESPKFYDPFDVYPSAIDLESNNISQIYVGVFQV